MSRAILVVLFALSSITSAFAQTTNIRATDPSTGRSVQVGDQTNNALRIRLVASDPTIAVSASSLPLPTGAATSANQATEIASLQLIDDLVQTQGSTTSGQKGSIIMGAVTTSAPSYTNGTTAYLSLDASGALRVVGSAGTTQYAEDAVHVSGDSMVFAGAIRRDTTPSSSAAAAGRYSAFNVDANGRLYTNAVLYDVSGAAVTPDTQLIGDGAVTPSSTTGSAQFYYGSSTAPTVVTTTHAVLPWGDLNGRLHVTGDASMSPVLATLSGTNNINNVSGTVSLPTGAATSANQTTEITSLQLIDDLPQTQGSTTSGQKGVVMMGAVTTSAPSYTTAQTAYFSLDTSGALRVTGGSGGASMTDDNGFSVGSTSFTPVGGTYKSTRDAVDDNDGGAFAMTAKRGAYVTLETPLAVSAMDETAGAVKTIMVSAAGSALTLDTQFTHDTALGTITSVTGGGTFYRASTATTSAVSADDDAVLGWADRNGRLHITGDASMGKLLVTPDANSSVNLAQVNGGTTAAGSGAANANTIRVVAATDSTLFGSGTAHDAADAGNPHKIGARATTSLSGVTLVSDADRTNLYAGVDGVIITRPYTNLEDIVTGNASNTDGASFEIIAAAGAGIKQYLTSVSCSNSSTTGIYVEIKSGTTVMYTLPVPAAAASDVNGVTKEFVVPLKPNAANEAWNIDGSAAVTTLRCSMVAFRSKI